MSTRTLGRHHVGPWLDRNGKPFAYPPVGPDYSPLRPGTRQTLAPHHYAHRALPGGVDEPTGLDLHPDAVLALAAAPAPASRDAVLAEMRADLTTTTGEETS